MGIITKNKTEVSREPTIKLSKEECEFLLTLISEGTFRGKHLQLVYDVTVKVQSYYEALNHKE